MRKITITDFDDLDFGRKTLYNREEIIMCENCGSVRFYELDNYYSCVNGIEEFMYHCAACKELIVATMRGRHDEANYQTAY